jgi:hypothetical protein
MFKEQKAMKVFRVVVVLAAVALAAFTILAQTQTRPAATPANIAIIDSSAFSDDKNGIARSPEHDEIGSTEEACNSRRLDDGKTSG